MPKGQTGTVAHFALERLEEHGVQRIYGYPGDGINGFLGALHEADVEFVQTRHEDGKVTNLQVCPGCLGEDWELA